ncbi:hypothetical protein SEA_LUNA18_3 [Microbacterium phage Luna18]|nr:hypothetical protein SEA_KATCHAN_3 [Microbacterium phage KatChan]URQ04854.1 hypothetical protein SEA_LUNA18_3 [Microbacterium phage Luna18]
MGYTIHNAQGQVTGGDASLSQNMKDWVDEHGGSITDDTTGATVYPQED